MECVADGWLSTNPFLNYKATLEDVERDFLTEEELEVLASKQFTIPRLLQVRDVFLFCCYTGLSYPDVKSLKHSEISTGIDGQKWILTSREKKELDVFIPTELWQKIKQFVPDADQLSFNQSLANVIKEFSIFQLLELSESILSGFNRTKLVQ